jgi:predicted membrane metal-binding protein
MAYRHTQIGWTMILILGIIIAVLAGAATASGGVASVVVLSVIGLLAICLVLFISQTVIVDDDHIELRMGPGLIRRRVPLVDVEFVDRERLPWWAVVYGIRMSVDGKRQLWRVSGSDAVDLRLSGERRLLITTDEPDALATVIRSAVEASR